MLALTTTSIAWLLFAVILGGWLVYAFLNIRQARDELGSEIEMAPNRKKYYEDEELEGPRLTRVLGIGVNTTGQEAEGPNCVGAVEH